MNKNQIKKFRHKGRSFYITFDVSPVDENESIQLNEEVIVKGKKLKHFIQSDGMLEKSDPIVFACRDESGEIEISMLYEGFPLKPMKEFIKEVENRWKKKA